MNYEKMVIEAYNNNLEICECKFRGSAKGYQIDDFIFINNKLNNSEKNCILAEELGHYNLTVGDITDLKDIRNMKQEIKARRWGYEKLIGLSGLIQAYKDHIKGIYNLAEYFGVTEEFFKDAINYYKSKYGISYEIDTYIIYFEPLGIIDKFVDF